jgi:hypothetical protein
MPFEHDGVLMWPVTWDQRYLAEMAEAARNGVRVSHDKSAAPKGSVVNAVVSQGSKRPPGGYRKIRRKTIP